MATNGGMGMGFRRPRPSRSIDTGPSALSSAPVGRSMTPRAINPAAILQKIKSRRLARPSMGRATRRTL